MIQDNFFKMPVFLKLIVLVGLLSPFVMMASTWLEYKHGTLHRLTMINFLVILLCAAIIFTSSLGIWLKKGSARLLYTIGLFLTCLTPLMWASTQDELIMFIPSLAFNLLICCTIGIYLFKGREVKSYFLMFD